MFRGEVKDISTRLSTLNILKSCARGLTQNQNESINNMIWSKCPKRVFCSKTRFTISVCESIIKWNEGAMGRKMFLQALNVTCGPNVVAGLRKENISRLKNARRKISDKYNKRRQVLRQQRKKKKNDNSYIPGAFSTKITPDIDFTTERQVNIMFIHDNNVVHHIKDHHTE